MNLFDKEVYTTRRQRLLEMFEDGILLIFGNTLQSMNYKSNTFPFRQDSNFLYFFGIDEPDLVGIIDIDEQESYLCGEDTSLEDAIWTGELPSVSELAKTIGIRKTLSNDELEAFIKKGIINKRRIHYLPTYTQRRIIQIAELLDIPYGDCGKYASLDLIKAIITLRSCKEPGEIAEIENTLDKVTYDMFTTAMKITREGMLEQDVHGKMVGIALQHGGQLAFPAIVTKNGHILHNHHHGNPLDNGDLLLMDAGAESTKHYATDITRTIPVSGKFTPVQKDVYQIVLAAQEKAIELISPGVTYRDIHLKASGIIAEGLKSMGILKGNVQDIVTSGAHALFFPHGLGHLMGLDVHDMEDLGEDYVGYNNEVQRSDQFGFAYLRYGKKLEENQVITVEPGIYFIPVLISMWQKEKKHNSFINYPALEKYLNFGGVRIEDDVLVTSNSSAILGKKIPKTIEQIEEIMKESI